MTKSATTIRHELERLVDNRLAEKGVETLFDFNKAHRSESLFDEPLCPFANRLCPDDLCWLPAGHPGAKDGYHITGTVAYDYALKWGYGKVDMQKEGSTRAQLILAGVRLQRLVDE